MPNNIRIIEALLAKSSNGFLKGHGTREVSDAFSIPMRTVHRIWDQGKKCLNQGIPIDVLSQKFKRGRKKKQVDVSSLQDQPISERGNSKMWQHFRVSKSKVQSVKRDGTITRVSNTVKPYLTELNKKERLKWCFSMLDPRTIPADPVFKGMFDYVFIDEKWFNITRKNERYYTVPE